MKEKTVHLRNKYSKEEVYTKNYDNVEIVNGDMKFIRVHTYNNPSRSYLANREAFEIITKNI